MRWMIRLVILVAAVFSVWRTWFFDGYTDFNVYYGYAEKVRDLWFGAKAPSFGVEPGNTSPFRYLPFWGVVFLPLSFLSIGKARAIFVSIQWLLYSVVFSRAQRTFQLKPLQQVLLLIGTFRFAWDNARIGQVSGMLLFFLWLAMPQSWDASGRARYLALAVSLKLQPIGLILIPMIKRRIGFLTAFGISTVFLLAASLVVGIEALESWAILSFSSLDVLNPATIGNQSLYGALIRTVPEHAKIAFVSILGVTALYLFRLWSKLGRPSQLGWFMGLAFLPIFGGLTWKNTYMITLIPLAFLIARGSKPAIFLAFAFPLLSQGLIGEKLNAVSLNYGVLPWVATVGWILAFHGLVNSFVTARERK